MSCYSTLVVVYFILQCWNALLSVDAPTPEVTGDWHNTIKPLIVGRIRGVVCCIGTIIAARHPISDILGMV